MGTRGRVRSPEKRSRIPQRTLKQLRNGASLRDRRWQAFRFVNSCRLETICGALVRTVEASFSA